MIIKITDRNSRTAYVDNGGQVNGSVSIQGDSPLVAHLNRILNSRLDIPFVGQQAAIDDKFKTVRNGLTVLYKASDVYLKEHFIPVDCPVFGYSVEVLKE